MTRNSPEQAHILIVGSGINFIDVAGCEALANEAHRLHVSGRQLYLCTLKGEVLNTLRRGGYLQRIGEENVFPSKLEAIGRIVPRLDPERCRVCTARIFRECAGMPGAKPSS
jgi:SulP family sulfate permease